MLTDLEYTYIKLAEAIILIGSEFTSVGMLEEVREEVNNFISVCEITGDSELTACIHVVITYNDNFNRGTTLSNGYLMTKKHIDSINKLKEAYNAMLHRYTELTTDNPSLLKEIKLYKLLTKDY